MLDAAVAMVNRAGLTVSLDHLSFEDIIRDARVSRSTVYRRWPYKDLFFSDLLKELAKAATPAALVSEVASAGLIKRVLLEHVDWLATPQLRNDLLLEVIRLGGVQDFETMRTSTEWRTYLALHATFLSVVDDDLREELGRALAASERDFVHRVALSWERVAALFGYRIRPGIDASFETIAAVVSGDVRGHVVMALADEDLATRRIRARPLGASFAAEWSPTALALAAVATAFLEPDPAVVWDEARIASVRRAFEALDAAEVAAR